MENLIKIALVLMLVLAIGCKLENKTIVEKTQIVPNWIKKKYEFENEIGGFQSVVFFKQINDSVSYCIYTKTEGFSCSSSYVVTLVDKKELQHQQISSKCDINFEDINYNYSTFKILKLNIVKKVNYVESIPDSLLKEGEIKKEFNIMEVHRKKDSTIQFYKISNKGNLIKK